jgi:cell division septation protein DedD
MTKAETSILGANNPAEYIEASLKSRLSPAAKAKLAKAWMGKTGYSREDILYARNRHPYWRKKKMEGSVERTRRRLAAHDYSTGNARPWTRKRVEEFLSLNAKGKDGRYERKDWQLAEHFGASIPSIQYMRRKCRKVEDLLGLRPSHTKVVDYLLCAESVLSRGSAAVEKVVKAPKAAKAPKASVAPKKPAMGKTVKQSAKSGAAKPKKAAAKPRSAAKAAPKAKPRARKS